VATLPLALLSVYCDMMVVSYLPFCIPSYIMRRLAGVCVHFMIKSHSLANPEGLLTVVEGSMEVKIIDELASLSCMTYGWSVSYPIGVRQETSLAVHSFLYRNERNDEKVHNIATVYWSIFEADP
jgi:hypothetical protein